MEFAIHNVTKIEIDDTPVKGINNRYMRSIYITDKDHGQIEISLFAEKGSNLIIKKEK